MLDRVRGSARAERSWDDRTASAYQILGVEIEASPQAIRRAYLGLVRVWHPDRYSGEPARRHEAEAVTKRINEAYEVLTRRAADRSRRSRRRSPRAGRNNSPRATSSPTPHQAPIQGGSRAARVLIKSTITVMICLMTLAAIFSIAYVIDVMDAPYGAHSLHR